MSQGQNRILDEFAKMMTDAAGAAQGVAREAETLVRSQAERLVQKMDLVSREEFETVRDMVLKALDENEQLKKRIDALELASAKRVKAAAKKAPKQAPKKTDS